MKKLFLSIALIFLSTIIFIPVVVSAAGLVPCNGPDCTITSFFEMLVRIYDFIVKMIATPLAVIALTIGGIMILISAGNPNLAGTGKKILWTAIIGLALVWCSYLIIDFILTTLGVSGGLKSFSI